MSSRVVHLELHTGNLPRACAFYTQLFGWTAEQVPVGQSSYLALGLGQGGFEGGVVESGTAHSLWLPYVEVDDIARSTAQARELGGKVALAPREGAAGWRAVIAAPAGAGVALWQRKR
jgi:predicted enzyme related to lactoylglutathione lyase